MTRYLAQHNTSGETFILATNDDGDPVAQSTVLHWSDWQEPGGYALSPGLDLFTADLDPIEEPYSPWYREWREPIASQGTPSAPVVDLR